MPIISSLLSDKFLLSSLVLAVLLVAFGNPALAFIAAASISLWSNRIIIKNASEYSKYSLQTAIVLIGFSMDADNLFALSANYALIVSLYVVITLFTGLLIGWMIRQHSIDSQLISTGTAICGGTAIASLSPILSATPAQTGMCLALVFILNALALLTFPYVGQWLELSQAQFGVWSALAIHDTSSVVATAMIFGEEAAQVATTLKLGRTLWLIPILVGFAIIGGSEENKGKLVTVPRFIFLFLGASVLASFLDLPSTFISATGLISNSLLIVALFLIGIATSRENLKILNAKHLIQGLAIWILAVTATLSYVMIQI